MIKKGDTVKIKQEWQDAGDQDFLWYAMDDEEKGRVAVGCNVGLPFASKQVVFVYMLEAE